MANPFPIKICPKVIESKVQDHIGLCAPVWINKNRVCNAVDGGVTGFFKSVTRILPGVYITTGEEFHGMIHERKCNVTKDWKYYVQSAD